MVMSVDSFSRISKLQVDRLGLPPEEAAHRRSSYRVALMAGPDVAGSPSLQAALLTAAATAVRCFPGAVSFHPPGAGFDVPLRVPYPARSLPDAVAQLGVTVGTPAAPDDARGRLAFGTRPDVEGALQVTFDGWVGAVGPAEDGFRLKERDRCVLAGVLAGALGVSELFMGFVPVTALAGHRCIGLSLWRPDLEWAADEAAGPVAEILPAEFWLLGLGHLGQAYLWGIGLLPFERPGDVNLLLNDFDTVVEANYETGLLTEADDPGRLKTRVAARWLEARGFRPRLVERPFDEHVRRYKWEPRLALCGFDGSGPRWALEQASFTAVIESGLGGRDDDFDTIALHTFPHPATTAAAEWPKDRQGDDRGRAERLASRNPVYREHGLNAGCGQVELAGRSVAVPFVGATAASLVLAEALRMRQEGSRCGSLRVQLTAPQHCAARPVAGGYTREAEPLLSYQRSLR